MNDETVFNPAHPDAEKVINLIDWLDEHPIEFDGATQSVRDVVASEANLRQLLILAILRVEIANREGNDILSGWLEDARKAIS